MADDWRLTTDDWRLPTEDRSYTDILLPTRTHDLEPWTLASVSGVLLALSFPKYGHPAFAWVALTPLLVFVFWIGLHPAPFTRVMHASVTHLLDQSGQARPMNARAVVDPSMVSGRSDRSDRSDGLPAAAPASLVPRLSNPAPAASPIPCPRS